MEALKSKKRNVVQLYVADNKAGHRAVEEIIRLAKRNNVKIDRMDVKMMDRLTKGGNHQGVLAKAQHRAADETVPPPCTNPTETKRICGWPWTK